MNLNELSLYLTNLTNKASCRPETQVKKFGLEGGWKLISLYGTEADADIYLEFAKGEFTIYQLTNDYDYIVFEGIYTDVNGVLSGRYNDGTAWVSDYEYILNEGDLTLTLINCNNPSEVAVYKSSRVPDVEARKVSRASADVVKPL